MSDARELGSLCVLLSIDLSGELSNFDFIGVISSGLWSIPSSGRHGFSKLAGEGGSDRFNDDRGVGSSIMKSTRCHSV